MRGVDARRTFLQYDSIFIEIALLLAVDLPGDEGRVAKRVVLGMFSWQIRVVLSKKEVDKSAISSRFKR